MINCGVKGLSSSYNGMSLFSPERMKLLHYSYDDSQTVVSQWWDMLRGTFSTPLSRTSYRGHTSIQARIQDSTTGWGQGPIFDDGGSPLCANRDLRFREGAMAPLAPPVYGPASIIRIYTIQTDTNRLGGLLSNRTFAVIYLFSSNYVLDNWEPW